MALDRSARSAGRKQDPNHRDRRSNPIHFQALADLHDANDVGGVVNPVDDPVRALTHPIARIARELLGTVPMMRDFGVDVAAEPLRQDERGRDVLRRMGLGGAVA